MDDPDASLAVGDLAYDLGGWLANGVHERISAEDKWPRIQKKFVSERLLKKGYPPRLIAIALAAAMAAKAARGAGHGGRGPRPGTKGHRGVPRKEESLGTYLVKQASVTPRDELTERLRAAGHAAEAIEAAWAGIDGLEVAAWIVDRRARDEEWVFWVHTGLHGAAFLGVGWWLLGTMALLPAGMSIAVLGAGCVGSWHLGLWLIAIAGDDNALGLSKDLRTLLGKVVRSNWLPALILLVTTAACIGVAFLIDWLI